MSFNLSTPFFRNGHGPWGMGHWALGIGHGVWGIGYGVFEATREQDAPTTFI